MITEETEEREREMQKEIKRLRHIVRELDARLIDGRDYLMQADSENLNVYEILEKFGFDNTGIEKINGNS